MTPLYDWAWFRDLVLRCDPAATKYHGSGASETTVWSPKGVRTIMLDDIQQITGWTVEVERNCKSDNDAVAAALLEALTESERVDLTSYVEMYDETDGVHTHLFTCEVY
ncbi:MAG: hypothetical protein Q4C04_04430 [Clostridia bacterium]|nr:hypothetical protein [Clostridia bacterium]